MSRKASEQGPSDDPVAGGGPGQPEEAPASPEAGGEDAPEGEGEGDEASLDEAADEDAADDEPDDADDADDADDDDADEAAALPATSAIDEVPPPNAFLKGAVVGLILLVPLTALAVYVLGRLDIGDPAASYYTIIAFVAVFAGLPAMITAGGVGRAAASALVRPGDRGGPRASTRVSAMYGALTAVGLVLLTVVPLGEVPTEVGTWVWIIALGGLSGGLGGFVLGLWVAYGSRKP